jgi:hypothetical protein
MDAIIQDGGQSYDTNECMSDLENGLIPELQKLFPPYQGLNFGNSF